jgi:Flp pilus assembly protein TadB
MSLLGQLRDFLSELVDPDRDGPLMPSRDQLGTLALYLACAAVYLAVGLIEVSFLLSLWVAVVYLLLTAWLVPAAVRRLT